MIGAAPGAAIKLGFRTLNSNSNAELGVCGAAEADRKSGSPGGAGVLFANSPGEPIKAAKAARHVAAAHAAAESATAVSSSTATATAAGLRTRGKQAAGKHCACQNHHHSSSHDILHRNGRTFPPQVWVRRQRLSQQDKSRR